MGSYHVEYSKTSRAKCHGPSPCKGSIIEAGELRFGQVVSTHWGESVQWRHWRCMTTQLLRNVAGYGLQGLAGFQALKPEDRRRVQTAIAVGKVEDAYVKPTTKIIDLTQSPSSSRLPPSSQVSSSSQLPSPPLPPLLSQPSMQPGPSSKKRKAENDERQIPTGHAPLEIIIDDDEEDDEDTIDELYCTISTSIVGVQYYHGLVGAGEQVRLVREPHNQYDRNAIQVKNIGHAQVGHIPRQVASKLAPFMDKKLITVEGVMLEGNVARSRGYSLSMDLNIFGDSRKRSELKALLRWAAPHQRPSRVSAASGSSSSGAGASASYSSSQAGTTHPSSQASAASSSRPSKPQAKAQAEAAMQQQEALRKAVELRQMLNNLEKVDDEGRRSSLLDTLCSTDDILNLPLHPNPPGISSGELHVDLLKHQSQALQWCIEHEYPALPKTEADKPVQFWQFRKNGNKPYYYNIATKTPQEAPPALGRGALCADSMGLGKTLTMLALIIATRKDITPSFSKSTLIVVPLSVISNWQMQIEEHCTADTLSSCVYYGAQRTMTAEELQEFDVIITTYQTVAGEHVDADGKAHGGAKRKRKMDSTLFDVQWKRIILDEGHNIRNPKTKTAKAVCALTAERRWVLSGTPIINSPRDLGSLLTFLQICRPLDKEDFYKRLLLRPLKDGYPEGAELLRALMSHICIRRTKEMQNKDGTHLVPLPPVEMTLVPVTLHPEARALYDAIEEISRGRFQNMLSNDGGGNAVANVLSVLTRLRQLALHPGLVPVDYLEQLRASEGNEGPQQPITITPAEKFRLQGLLARMIEDSEECPICISVLDEPRITYCAHAFCFACITEVVLRDPKCPMDRRPITAQNLVEPALPGTLTQLPPAGGDAEGGIRSGSSAKIDQLVHLLKLTPSMEKSLVFSQFTSFLDKIANTLEEESIPYVRFDGQMSAKQRQETLLKFGQPVQEETTAGDAPEELLSRGQRSGRALSSKSESAGYDDEDPDFVDGGVDEDEDDITNSGDDFISCKKSKTTRKAKARAKGKGKAKASSPVGISTRDNPKVMLISLKAGALGLNLTVANNVYLMDPWWQEGIESQAIDRCNRIGQKRPVHVYQLIAENTVESKVLEIQERKKTLIQQAFSGIKRTETQRQKKEARLQDLIELFGVRQQQASQRLV